MSAINESEAMNPVLSVLRMTGASLKAVDGVYL
jgi:hypothetical protein